MAIRVTWICDACSRGNHRSGHMVMTADGSDGGCSNALWENGAMLAVCTCAVVLPPVPVAKRHCPTCRCGGA